MMLIKDGLGWMPGDAPYPGRLRKATTAEYVAEIARLRADAVILQARKPDGGEWIDIFPAQLQWMAKEGYDVRALDKDGAVQQEAAEK